MNTQYLKDIATRCRQLARTSSDAATASKLLELSEELQNASEQRSSKAEERPYLHRLG